MATILLATQGTGGDLYPFIEIASALKTHHHKVILITSEKFAEQVWKYGLDFRALEADQDSGLFQSHGIPKFAWPFMNLYRTIKRCCEGEKTVLVSHCNFNPISQLIAEKLRLPFITIYPAPYFAMSTSVMEQRLNSQAESLNRLRRMMNLPPVSDWRLWLASCDAQIGLWPEWFAPNDPSWLIQVSPVGFIYKPEFEAGEIPEDLKEISQGDDPPVLITHGTSRPAKTEFFSVAIEACKNLGCRAISVTMYDDLLPDTVYKDVKRYKYLPFATVLPLMKAIIHHGGIGTLNQAMMAGIPQLVLAFEYDRPDNGSRIQQLNIGSWLPPSRWTDYEVTKVLRRIMTDEITENCKRLSLKHRNAEDPVARVCAIINNLSLQ